MSTSAQAHERSAIPSLEATLTGPRRTLAVVLAGVGGLVDGVGFLALFGLFIAHMSGNSTHLGVGVGTGVWDDALAYGYPIGIFVVAVAVGALIVDTLRRRGVRSSLAAMLGFEAALLVTVWLVGTWIAPIEELTRNSAAFFVLVGLAVTAMGVQSATLRHVGALTVHTTFITGMLTTMGVQLAALLRPGPYGRAPALRLLALASGVWVAYLGGAVVGALLFEQWRLGALGVPVLALLVAAVVAHRRGLPADGVVSGIAPG